MHMLWGPTACQQTWREVEKAENGVPEAVVLVRTGSRQMHHPLLLQRKDLTGPGDGVLCLRGCNTF